MKENTAKNSFEQASSRVTGSPLQLRSPRKLQLQLGRVLLVRSTTEQV
jgi:hypothetical protein